MSVRRFVERLRSALWFLPGVFLVLAIAQALAIPEWEERHGGSAVGEFFFEGGPDGARVLLSMVSGSTLTLMVLVFSITIVALQLASSQFSPRVLRSFLRDWYSQLSLGVFTATFAYSITVLRAVRSDEAGSTPFVPRLAVALAFFWALASVVVFVLYVHHTASSIRVVSVIERIGRESRAMIEREYLSVAPAADIAPAPDEAAQVLTAPVSGVVTDVEIDRLHRLAEAAGVNVRLAARVGDFVPAGAPLLLVSGGRVADTAPLLRTVGLGAERTYRQDVRYGFRQLVDIAERALSPAINDPTTAVQALDRIHDLLRLLGTAEWPAGAHGRVTIPQVTWDEVVRLAVDEIRLNGSTSLQVDRRLRDLLTDLAGAVPQDRRAVVDEELALLEAGVRRSIPDEADRSRALAD